MKLGYNKLGYNDQIAGLKNQVWLQLRNQHSVKEFSAFNCDSVSFFNFPLTSSSEAYSFPSKMYTLT